MRSSYNRNSRKDKVGRTYRIRLFPIEGIDKIAGDRFHE